MTLCLRDVAKSAKMTEFEYGTSIFRFLENGDIINTLNLEAQANICDWINEHSLLNGKPFCIEIHISMSLQTNIVVYCLCKMNLMEDEPKVTVEKNVMGLLNNKPKEFDNLLSYVITMPMLLKNEFDNEEEN